MTTTNSNEIVKNQNKSAHGDSREAQHAYFTLPLAANPVANDIFNFGYLPAFARVVGACVSADRIDTNGSPTFAMTVGDGGFGSAVAADTARYFTATTIGRAATPFDANASSAMNGRAQNFQNAQPADLLVFGTCTVTCATFAAGNLHLRVSYYIDEPASTLNQ